MIYSNKCCYCGYAYGHHFDCNKANKRQTIGHAIAGNGNKMQIGHYEIREMTNGNFWIEHESGEGTEVKRDSLEANITQFYADNF